VIAAMAPLYKFDADNVSERIGMREVGLRRRIGKI
jgi:hypothetical protein